MKNLLEKRLQEAGYEFSPDIQDSFAALITELKKWNKTVNLTAIHSDEDIIVKHLIDSLALLRFLKKDERILDIGSGAGFPSIPLKLVSPGNAITSVDAVRKKIMFQKHLSRFLGLQHFYPLHSRVEEMYTDSSCFFDVIVSRAFSRLDQFVSLALPLLKKEGRLLAMKGPAVKYEMEEAEERLHAMNVIISAVDTYQLPAKYGERRIITLTFCE